MRRIGKSAFINNVKKYGNVTNDFIERGARYVTRDERKNKHVNVETRRGAHLGVDAEEVEHDEKGHRPQLWTPKRRESFWVHDERKTLSWSGRFFYRYSVRFRHVAQNRENSDSAEHRSAEDRKDNDEGVPVI